MVVWNTSDKKIVVHVNTGDEESIADYLNHQIVVNPGHGIDFHSIGLKSHQEIMRDQHFKRLPEFKTYLKNLRKEAGETNPELLPDEEAI